MSHCRRSQNTIDFQSLIDAAERNAYSLQPWSDYYRLRANEMRCLFSMYRPSSYGKALDIGSGIGFNALLLDRFYDKTVAIDLYAKDPRTHSLGIEKVKRFLDSASCKDIDIISCRCEHLPFRDDYFDTVYMIYTLEHINDRRTALREARRILKPHGEVVVVVPGFLERLFYPLSYYRIFFRKILSYFKGKSRTGARDFHASILNKKQSYLKRLFSAYPHFPLPEPHGEYPNYFNELVKSISFIWFKLAEGSNLRIKEVFTTMLFPKELSSFFLGERALEFYIKTLWINKKYGKNRFFRHLGQNLCLILEKSHV